MTKKVNKQCRRLMGLGWDVLRTQEFPQYTRIFASATAGGMLLDVSLMVYHKGHTKEDPGAYGKNPTMRCNQISLVPVRSTPLEAVEIVMDTERFREKLNRYIQGKISKVA